MEESLKLQIEDASGVNSWIEEKQSIVDLNSQL